MCVCLTARSYMWQPWWLARRRSGSAAPPLDPHNLSQLMWLAVVHQGRAPAAGSAASSSQLPRHFLAIQFALSSI